MPTPQDILDENVYLDIKYIIDRSKDLDALVEI